MSHDENFKDPTTIFHWLVAVVVLVGMPLLPMLMGWYTLLA